MNNRLIQKSKNILNSLNLKELKKAGIEREAIKLSSHSHHIVTYPPLDALLEIQPLEIYSTISPKSPREIALYLHLPFCTGKCLYCAYVSLPNQPKEFVDKYLEAVEKEINLLLSFPELQEVTINSIYIGGGTPTYLSSKQLEKIFKLLKNKFSLKKEVEITVETEPETLTGEAGEEKLKTLLQNRVNRLSIGFQTLNDDILRLLRRRHNSQQAINSYNLAKNIGFKNINIDIIPGLPDQTLKIWQNDLKCVAELSPPSITSYPLSIKQTAALWPMYQQEKQRFPGSADIILLEIMTTEFLNDLGYNQRPVWWFTKSPEYVYKQQIHKWGELGEQLALGVSAYSFINDFQYFNYRNVAQYIKVVEGGDLPIWKGAKLSKEDLMRRMIMFGLKTGLNQELFKIKFSKKPKEVFKNTWEKLEKLGLIEEGENLLQLSYKGKLFADEIAREFYQTVRKRHPEQCHPEQCHPELVSGSLSGSLSGSIQEQ